MGIGYTAIRNRSTIGSMRKKPDMVTDQARKAIGRYVARLRDRQDLDQIDVVERAKVSDGTVYAIERGTRDSLFENVLSVVYALGGRFTDVVALALNPHATEDEAVARADALIDGVTAELAPLLALSGLEKQHLFRELAQSLPPEQLEHLLLEALRAQRARQDQDQ